MPESTGGSDALGSLTPQAAKALWSKQQLGTLWQHLQNGNDDLRFVQAFRDSNDVVQFFRSRTLKFRQAISWGIDSAFGKPIAKGKMAFAPYSQTEDGNSRWAAFDFDAHDGNLERARAYAIAAWDIVHRWPNFFVILETSGSGGWHVWLISEAFYPNSFWISNLRDVAGQIRAPIRKGICEIFPASAIPGHFGTALRAPGSWNPTAEIESKILWHNADALIQRLPPFVEKPYPLFIGKLATILSEGFPKEKEVPLSQTMMADFTKLIGDPDRFRITERATRHGQLESLVGSAIHQMSRSVAEAFARHQFTERRFLLARQKLSTCPNLPRFGVAWSNSGLLAWAVKRSRLREAY